MSIETPESRHETAKKELDLIVRAFSATGPNTKEEQLAAERLIDDLIFQRLSYRVTAEDWASHLEEIRKAAEIIAESLIKEATQREMAPEEVRRRLGLMIECGFIDPARNPLMKSFMEGNL